MKTIENDPLSERTKFWDSAKVASLGVALLVGIVLVFLNGCSSKSSPNPENFKTGLNKYFSEKKVDCLFKPGEKFPYTTSNADEQKQLDVLEKAQLLTRTKEKDLAYYEASKYGATSAPLFCYGHREVTAVDSFTPPALANGFNESKVSYHYQMTDVPLWAKGDDVKAAFPDMAKATSGNATGTTVMAQTSVGWQVPD